jgi:hypothetical protein
MQDAGHCHERAAAKPVDVGDEHGRVLGTRVEPTPLPHRFEDPTPAIFLGHYVEERTLERRLGRKATWDRLTFHSWASRRVWLSGQERIAFGEPQWEHVLENEVAALLGREEMRALPPEGSDSRRPTVDRRAPWALTANRRASSRHQESSACLRTPHRPRNRVGSVFLPQILLLPWKSIEHRKIEEQAPDHRVAFSPLQRHFDRETSERTRFRNGSAEIC